MLWAVFLGIGWQRFLGLVSAIIIIRLASRIILPIVGIAAKWCIVGRLKQGDYPVFGRDYLRWWTVEQLLAICGRGAFQWSATGMRV